MAQNNSSNGNRGFAAMEPEEQRRIASKGGRASHASGNAHEWDSREAAEAGHLGGIAAHHHDRAAFHHETAAHHHSRASAHRAAGSSRQADLHGQSANTHSREADYHSAEAARHGRGFAGMDPERQREIAREGGRASHGGRSDQRQNNDQERSGNRSTRGGTPEQHAEAGRRGAEARWGNRQDSAEDDEPRRGREQNEGYSRSEASEQESGNSGGRWDTGDDEPVEYQREGSQDERRRPGNGQFRPQLGD